MSVQTGIGKTELLSQLSLYFCMECVVTIWGSFLIPILRLAARMLPQLHRSMGGHGNLDMDQAVGRLRSICTKDDVYVTLVVHPIKKADGEKIQFARVFGSAKVTQEAEHFINMKRIKGSFTQLENKKNRYDVKFGNSNLIFDRNVKIL